MKMYRGEYNLEQPKFPKGSLAECKPADGPVDINEPDIAYSKEDDEAIDQFHREKVSTSWHSVRLCSVTVCWKLTSALLYRWVPAQ